MELGITDHGDVRILTVGDERIDAAVAIQFKETVRQTMGDTALRVVLDLSSVTFLDSSGLGAIVAAMKLLGPERKLELAGLQTNVARVFTLTRMDTVFTIHPKAEDALASEGIAKAG